jgi:hypothetical protein
MSEHQPNYEPAASAPPGRPSRKSLFRILGVVGALAVAALGISACTFNRTEGSSTPTPPKTVTVAPKPASKPPPKPKPAPTKTVIVPAPAPTKTVIVPAPAPAQAAPQSDPWAVVSAYYADVTSHDYWDAWNLLGPDFQASHGSYDSFVAGYRDTGAQIVYKIGETGDQVTYQLESVNPDGTVQIYEGTATVYGGKIQHTDVHQTYGNPNA